VPQRSPQRPCILVLDDEEAVLEAFGRSISDEELELVLVRTLNQAFLQLESRPVAVFVCDYLIDTLNGELVLAETRKRYPSVYRVMLSAAPPQSVHTLMDSGVVQRLITKPWEVASLRSTLREVAGLPPLARGVAPAATSGARPVMPSGSFPPVDPGQALLVVSREPEFHLLASTTARQQGMTVKLMENVGLALTELRERPYTALVLDDEVPLASLVLATYNQLEVAPRLIQIRSEQRKNEPAQTSRVLCKPVTAEALASALSAPRRTGGPRISRARVTLSQVPLAGMLAELEERMRKAEELARNAQREMEKGAESNLARALADATLAATLAPKRDDFQELRRRLLGSVNVVRARESYARAKALDAGGQTEAALQELERAVERDPRAEHLVAAGELWLKLGRELPRARQFTQLALVLEPGNGRAKALFVEVSRALGLSQASNRHS